MANKENMTKIDDELFDETKDLGSKEGRTKELYSTKEPKVPKKKNIITNVCPVINIENSMNIDLPLCPNYIGTSMQRGSYNSISSCPIGTSGSYKSPNLNGGTI